MRIRVFYSKIILLQFLFMSNLSIASTISYNHIYVDQINGINNSNTEGSESDPFKSITYALYLSKKRELQDPWHVHIKSGTYDANPDKNVTEREIFPILLRERMIIEGDDGAENCTISGSFSQNSNSPIIQGDSLSNISLLNISILNMNRTGNGAGCYFSNCWGVIRGCIFQNNTSSWDGGAIYLSIPNGFEFQIIDNRFISNYAKSGGGGLFVVGHFSGKIENNIFQNNIAEKNMGGAFILWHSEINSNFFGNIKNNKFINNTSNTGGGAFWIDSNLSGDISNNHFKSNQTKSSYSNGGSFYIHNNVFGNIYNNEISNNSSQEEGGGFAIHGKITGDIFNNTITNNYSCEEGGGFYVQGDFIGNIYNNTFIANISDYDEGGGFYLNENFEGEIYENVFIKNSSDEYGGGFCIKKAITGNIINNTFIHNSSENNGGGGFIIGNEAIGNINDNVFIGNLSKWAGGGFWVTGHVHGTISCNFFSNNWEHSAIYIDKLNGHETLISNNIFLYNPTGIISRQSLNIENNTFFHNNKAVAIEASVSNSFIFNNIFAYSWVAIWEKEELNIPIKNNNFFNNSNFLLRNNQEMGNDLFFTEMVLNSFSDNNDWNPLIVGEGLDYGVWTDKPHYSEENNLTVFTDNNKNWEKDKWIGSCLNISNSNDTRQHYIVISNSENQIMVENNISNIGLGGKDKNYCIDDYRLAKGSNNIDSGIDLSIVKDFEYDVRPQGGNFDIGADEFFMGEIVPGISHTSITAADISQTSAVIKAKINPNSLTTTCYFEYGIDDTNYEYRSDEFGPYTGMQLHHVETIIDKLIPDNIYYFRIVATNTTGTAFSSDHKLKTLPVDATVQGQLKFSISKYTGLCVANTEIALQGTNITTTTDNEGKFVFSNLPLGKYVLNTFSSEFIPLNLDIQISKSGLNEMGVINMEIPSSEEVIRVIEQSIFEERIKWDIDNNNKKGLPEAIESLKAVSGVSP